MNIRSRSILACCLLALPASAQGIAYEWSLGSTASSSVSAGDVDGDGVADFALGAKAGGSTLGRVELRSGADGGLLWTAQGATPNDGFGTALVNVGDLDGDGSPDLVASAPDLPLFGLGPTPHVRAVSGADGSTLWVAEGPSQSVQFGRSLARISDLDGDGIDDVIIGSTNLAPDATQVRSGATGGLLFAVPPPLQSRHLFGTCVDSLGDLDGDGVADFGVGDPSFALQASGHARGRITLHSGVDGGLLGAVLAPAQAPVPWGHFGSRFAGLGDLDGDGSPEVLVGAPWSGTIGSPAGMAWVLSCADGSVVHAFAPEPGSSLSSFGHAVARTDDVDGDGVADLRVGAGAYVLYWSGEVLLLTSAELRTYSGASGALIDRWEGLSSNFHTPVPDANGDGRSDVLLGGNSIRLVLDGLANPVPVAACPGQESSTGCVPQVQVQGTPSLTQFADLEMRVSKLPVGTVGLCIYGPNPATLPFGHGLLCVAPPFLRSALQPSTTQVGSCLGQLSSVVSVTLAKTDLAALGLPAGAGFHLQGWFRDPGVAPPNDFGLSGSLFVELWP